MDDVTVLIVKVALALTLLAAGSAKLADVRSFMASVRLFVPRGADDDTVRALALAAGVAEILVGGASLSFPGALFINAVVLAAGCLFVAISSAGYRFHRGVACRCFGQLSNRTFDALGVLRSFGLAALAGYVVAAGYSTENVSLPAGARLLLLVTAGVLAVATFTAARALGVVAQVEPPTVVAPE